MNQKTRRKNMNKLGVEFRGLDRSIWTYQNGFVKAIKYLLLGDWVKCREAIFILKMSFYE